MMEKYIIGTLARSNNISTKRNRAPTILRINALFFFLVFMLIFCSTSFAVGKQQVTCSNPNTLWPIVLKWLSLEDIMNCRGVCHDWSDRYVPECITMKYSNPEKRCLIDPRFMSPIKKEISKKPEVKQKNKMKNTELKLVHTIQRDLSWDEGIKKINILPDSNNLIIFITGNTGDKIEIWDIEKKICLMTNLIIQHDNISSIHYIHTSRLVIFKTSDYIVKSWQWQNNTTRDHDKTVPVYATKLTPNFSSKQQQGFPSIKGEHWKAEVTSEGDKINIKARQKKKSIRTLKGLRKQSQLQSPASLGFSPDEQWLIASYYLGSVFIWNLVTGQHLATLPPSDGEISLTTFSQNSKLIIYASDSGKILIYSII